MKTPINKFKLALKNKQAQIGLWQGLAAPYPSEICASAGFDWLLVDSEHSPNDLQSTLQQLQIIAAYPETTAIVRVPHGYGDSGAAIIKQHLDLGVQTLLLPMIDTPEQAAHVVAATRYAPHGIRGVAGGRASVWGRIPDYAATANDQMCVLVQIESQLGLDNLDAICAVEGVDGVFIGPSDLAASLGYLGQPMHPEALKITDDAFARIIKSGKAAGYLTADEKLAQRYLDMGVTFMAVGLDNNILVRGTKALVERFKNVKPTAASTSGY